MLDRLKTAQLSRRELSANTMAMLELVKPEGLGGFSVLIQERGSGVAGYLGTEARVRCGCRSAHPAAGSGAYTPHGGTISAHLAMDLDELWPSERSL